MYKRLLLALMLATVLVLPVFANVSAESKCDVSALGVFNGDVELEPDWNPIIYTCTEGSYLDAGIGDCNICPAGSYCSGVEDAPFNGGNQGIAACETGWTSDEGTMSESACYKMNTIACSERNPYTYGHGSAVYANENIVCKTFYGTEECLAENEHVCDIVSLDCAEGYSEDTVDGVLQCVLSTVPCGPGYYMPADSKTCAVCPGDAYCEGGDFKMSQPEADGIVACDTGLFAPRGARSENDCGRLLHVGDDIIHLHKDKRTEHALVVNVDGVNYYADTTPVGEDVKTMNPDTEKTLRIKIDDVEYYVHETIYVNETTQE